MPGDIGNLLACLTMMPCVELPNRFDQFIQSEARRLPTDSLEDFLSLVLVECLEQTQRGGALDAHGIKRVVWRVRKRMARELQQGLRHCPSDPALLEDRKGVEGQPDRLASQSEQIENLVSLLTAQEATLLELLLSGWSQREIASVTGRSEATVSRLRASIRRKLAPLVKPDTSQQ